MELTSLKFSLERRIGKDSGKPYTAFIIENRETGEVETIIDKKFVQTIKSILLEI